MKRRVVAQHATTETPIEQWLESILRPFIGASIGLISFTLVAAPFFLDVSFLNSYDLYPLYILKFFAALLLSPGVLVLALFFRFIHTPPGTYCIIFGFSSLPFIVIGFLLFVKERFTKYLGIVFLILYCLVLMCGAPFWLSIWS